MRQSALKKTSDDTTINILTIPIFRKGDHEITIRLLAYCTSGIHAHKCDYVDVKLRFTTEPEPFIYIDDYKREKSFPMEMSITPIKSTIGTNVVIGVSGPNECFITWIADAEIERI